MSRSTTGTLTITASRSAMATTASSGWRRTCAKTTARFRAAVKVYTCRAPAFSTTDLHDPDTGCTTVGEHTARSFDADIDLLRSNVLKMGGLVERQVQRAVDGIRLMDLGLVAEVLADE